MANQDLQLLTEHRRALHRIPEFDRELYQTNEYVSKVLGCFDCELTPVVHTGVLAYFDRGKEETIAYRTDMDALLMEEENVTEYSSVHPGKMHACGHDGHMSILLAFAKYLDAQKELPYNVLLIFQPAEEASGGAKEVGETGVFKKYNVKKLYGLHIWPGIPKGRLASKPGHMMAQSNELSFQILGKSAHAATPDQGIDALHTGCRFVLDLYKMQREEIPREEKTILKIGRFDSGTVRNSIAEKTSCLGTMRAFKPELLDYMTQRMEEIAHHYEETTGCRFSFAHKHGYAPVINDPALYRSILPGLQELNYEELAEAVLASEDFSFYSLHLPTVFFFLGTGEEIALHNNRFDFDEEILLSGLALYKKLLYL